MQEMKEDITNGIDFRSPGQSTEPLQDWRIRHAGDGGGHHQWNRLQVSQQRPLGLEIEEDISYGIDFR